MRPSRLLVLFGATLLVSCIAPSISQNEGGQLPPLALEEPENIQIIENGGFEDPQSGAWRLSDWPPRPETGAKLIAKSIYYSQEVVHSGDWAVCFDLSTVGEDRHLLVQQSFGADRLAPYDGHRVRMSAWVWLASGPPGYQGGLSIRQWGKPGAPPMSSRRVRLPGARGQWTYAETEWTLRLGETTRGDITVGMSQVPDLADAPVVYVDDVKLEVLAGPALSARLLSGRTLLFPDDVLPIKIEVGEAAWNDGQRSLRWNITSPDGLTGYAEGDLAPAAASLVVEVTVPDIPEGRYAVRLALGAEPGERATEVLLPFRRAEGPFAR